jgi:hypothetical protein
VVELVLSIHKALGSVLSTGKKEKKKSVTFHSED